MPKTSLVVTLSNSRVPRWNVLLLAALVTGCGGDSSNIGGVTAPPAPPIVPPVTQTLCTTETIALCSSPETAIRVLAAVDDAIARSVPALSDPGARTEMASALGAVRAAISARSISSLRTSTTQLTERLTLLNSTVSVDSPDRSAIQLAVRQAQFLLENSN